MTFEWKLNQIHINLSWRKVCLICPNITILNYESKLLQFKWCGHTVTTNKTTKQRAHLPVLVCITAALSKFSEADGALFLIIIWKSLIGWWPIHQRFKGAVTSCLTDFDYLTLLFNLRSNSNLKHEWTYQLSGWKSCNFSQETQFYFEIEIQRVRITRIKFTLTYCTQRCVLLQPYHIANYWTNQLMEGTIMWGGSRLHSWWTGPLCKEVQGYTPNIQVRYGSH